MSGPKEADVQAQFNILARSMMACQRLMEGTENKLLKCLKEEISGNIRKHEGELSELKKTSKEAIENVGETMPKTVKKFLKCLETADKKFRNAIDTFNKSEAEYQNALSLQKTINESLEKAIKEYELVKSRVQGISGSYLDEQSTLVSDSQKEVNAVKIQFEQVQKIRKNCEKALHKAKSDVKEAQSAFKVAEKQFTILQKEVFLRNKAYEEAEKILDMNKKNALMLICNIKSAFESLLTVDADKFCAKEYKSIEENIIKAEDCANKLNFNAVTQTCEAIQICIENTWQDAMLKKNEFDKKKAFAESLFESGKATLDSVDEDFIIQWANEPYELDTIKNNFKNIKNYINTEAFDEAINCANAFQIKFEKLINSAYENKASDEKRTHIGVAIIEVLQEMGFEVSFEKGDLKEPFKISGLTSDLKGKGDFDISIPLDGKVDFLVDSEKNDNICIASVLELEKKLQSRGVDWKTRNIDHPNETFPIGKRQTMESHKIKNLHQ